MALLTKVKASTLLEPLLAMVTLLTVFGIACVIFGNVLKADNKTKRFNACLLLNTIADSCISKRSFLDETFEIENILVEKKVSKYNSSVKAYVLSLKAFEGKKLIAETNQVIIDK